MLTCFVTEKHSKAIPIRVITESEFPAWLTSQSTSKRNWFAATGFDFQNDTHQIIPDEFGNIGEVISCVSSSSAAFELGTLPFYLPQGIYFFEGLAEPMHQRCVLAWGLGAYQFTRYREAQRQPAQLYLPSTITSSFIPAMVDAIFFIRDLINTPTEDMGPTEFSQVTATLAAAFSAKFSQIIGDQLLKNNFASIHTVGCASDDAPRLLELRWGNAKHPKLTLVGKGVCFDSGGLDIKGASFMQLMKKDMGGAAHVLGLAKMIMAAKLPVYLRVLIPVVENAIAGNAYRPGDIIKSRSGKTIEVGNTDAEGRVILADALTYAVEEKPDLLIDVATLTGAARVALGPDLPAVFANNEEVIAELLKHSCEMQDPLWRLPLFTLYRDFLRSPIADINNQSSEPYGGAITAALFLKEFVPDSIPWLHFDLMAWNLRARPSHPIGGEAMAVRALFSYLQQRFGESTA